MCPSSPELPPRCPVPLFAAPWRPEQSQVWRSLSRPSHCDKGPDILRTSQGQMLWSTERCCEKTRGRLPNSQCYVGIQQTEICFSWGLSNFLNSLGSPWFSETIKHIYLCLPSVPANIWSLTLVLCFLSLVSDYILERVSDGKTRPKAHKKEFKQLTNQRRMSRENSRYGKNARTR